MVSIWRITREDQRTNLEEAYNLSIHKRVVSALHINGNIILALEENLFVTVDEMVSLDFFKLLNGCFLVLLGQISELLEGPGLLS